MRRLRLAGIAGGLVWLAGGLQAAGFGPFSHWKKAVIVGDQAALERLYSRNPPAVAHVGKTTTEDLQEELRYWAGLGASGVTKLNPKVLEMTAVPGQMRLLLRIEGMKGGQELAAAMVQVWTQEPEGWRITATGRSEFSPNERRRLPEPATPNTDLYPEPGAAQAELKAAEATAGKEHKRVLVVFGGNWCYDCHVLDATFHSKEFAPLVNANYVVVHVNIGDEGKDNGDLAARLGVALNHGVPSLAVLDAAGKVVVAQKNGEFESTVKIGPAEVRAFLEKYKEK